MTAAQKYATLKQAMPTAKVPVKGAYFYVAGAKRHRKNSYKSWCETPYGDILLYFCRKADSPSGIFSRDKVMRII
jgi:hypothetical protein